MPTTTKWLQHATRWSFWPAMLLVCERRRAEWPAPRAANAYGRAVAPHDGQQLAARLPERQRYMLRQGQPRAGEQPEMDTQTTGLVYLGKRDIAEQFGDLDVCKERRKRLYRLNAAQMSAETLRLRSMKVLGVGSSTPWRSWRYRRCAPLPAAEKLDAYIGLNTASAKAARARTTNSARVKEAW